MRFSGIDYHKRYSHLTVLDEVRRHGQNVRCREPELTRSPHD